jgi:short-subunit dehydrogenase
MPNSNPVALVTGASSGIGEVFARRLSARGYRLILVARRRDRLAALAEELGEAEVLPADLSNQEGLAGVEERIRSEPRLELLVNNAGFGTQGLFFENPLDSQDVMHRLHVMATMRLTHAALREMVPRRKGAVINVSSIAALGQSPNNVSYCATKVWINSFTEGLDLELKSVGSPVKVQALCPGFTRSEFHQAMSLDLSRLPAWLWLSAGQVVDTSLESLDSGKVIVIPGGIYKSLAILERILPRWLRSAAVIRATRRRDSPRVPQKTDC